MNNHLFIRSFIRFLCALVCRKILTSKTIVRLIADNNNNYRYIKRKKRKSDIELTWKLFDIFSL